MYRCHYTFVWRSLLRLGVDESAVDDAVQDVFIVVHRKLDDFEGRAAVRTWLFAIARRIALRYRDRARRRAQDEPEADTPTDRDRPDTALSCNEALRQLQDWLDELDEDKRAVFILSEFEQMRAPEIASILGANLNTVYARLRAARQHVARRARRESNMESYRASVRTISEARPAAGAGRRTWGLLIAKLSLGKTAVATTGIGASLSLSSGFLAKVAVAAAVIGGTSFAAGSFEDNPTPSNTPAIASAQSVTADAVRPHVKPPPPPLASGSIAPTPLPEAQEVVADLPLAPSMVALLAGPQKERRKQAHQGQAKVKTVEAEPNPFAAELERFEQAKVAARRSDTRVALERIDGYLREFPRGTFAMEAAALRVRTLCKANRNDEAKSGAAAFEAKFGSSKLVDATTPCK